MPQVSYESFEREEEEDAMATAASREAMGDNLKRPGARSRIKPDAAVQRNARSEQTRYSTSSTDDDDDDDAIRSNESSRSSSSSSPGPNLDKYNEMIDQMIGLKFSDKIANNENGKARLEETRAETGKKKEGGGGGDEDDDEDEDLVERGPVRPHAINQSHHEKPYYTLNWLASSGQNIDNNNQLYMSDYECLSEIVQNKQLYEKLDPYIDKLSNESEFDRSNYFVNNGGQESNGNRFNDAIGEFENVLEMNNGAAVSNLSGGNEASNGAMPVVVTSDIGDSILQQLTKGAYQEAGSMYEAAAAAVAGSSPQHHNRHNWPDSPASGWPHNENVPSVSSGSAHSRSSSRAQSPGSSVHVGSDIGGLQQYGPMGGFSPQQTGDMKNEVAAGTSFRVCQALSSSESSNHSFGDTSSPLSYESAIDHTAEQQLGFEFDSFSTGYPNYMSSDTLVNTAEIIDAIVDNEIQRVQQQVAEMAGQKDEEQAAAAALSPPRSEGKDAVATIATADSCNVYDVDAMAYAECMQINNFPSNDSFNNSAESFIDFNNTFENLLASRYADSAAAIPATISDSSSNLETNNAIDYLANGSGISRADAAATKISQSPFNEFQIPETVSAFRRQNHLRRYSERQRAGGAPWPCLNLPDTAASERLKAQLDPREVEKAMKDLLKRPREELAAADKDGDTMLMCLVGNGRELEKKKAYLVPLVERIGSIEGSLTMTNNRDEDALYIAAVYCPEMEYVTGYLAAAMLQKNIDIGKRLYRGGNNLIHVLAAKGDSHAPVLAELLALEMTARPEGNVSVFDLCQRNYTGRTALQIAVESHDPSGPSRISCLGVTQLLLKNGADQRMQEMTPLGNTALHTAVSLCRDPLLVKTLLLNKDAREVVNMPNGMNDTPVHLAFGLSTDALPITAQIQICMDLIEAGGRTDLPNGQGKSPFALVSPDRRETMRNVFFNKKQDQEHLGFVLAGR